MTKILLAPEFSDFFFSFLSLDEKKEFSPKKKKHINPIRDCRKYSDLSDDNFLLV